MGSGVGGGIVGTGGGSVGGLGVGVRVGTVCRDGLCPGAAHRSGPVVSAVTISIPRTMSQRVRFLFMALS